MTDVPFPMLTAPGQSPQVSGGRLINCYPEPNAATAGKPNTYWRVPGLNVWGTAPAGSYRGGIQVGGLFYALFGTTVYIFTALGGAGASLPGAVPGTAFCWFAVNQAATPDVVVVSPGVGAFVITNPAGVANYPDPNVNFKGAPNCVVYHQGYFIFTSGSGGSMASGLNATTVNTLDNTTAQTKPDGLLRPLPLGYGQILLVGSATMEVWGGINTTGYPFSYSSTIYRGIPGPSAICGNEDGWGKGIFFVGDDNKVSTLTTYTPTPISIPDLDILIEAEPDKSKIIVGCYVARGHGFVVVQGPTWCWEYDTTIQSWHQRRSYLQPFWRGYQPINVFGQWLCGDVLSSSMLKLDGTVRREGGISDVQTLSTTGAPTGGSFTLSFGGVPTTAIAYNATAAQVQTALQSLVALNGNVVCAGGPLPASVTIAFAGTLKYGLQPAIAVATNSLTGGASPVPVMAHPTQGVAANPLPMRIETGPLGAFPQKVRVNSIELYMTKGASDALGHAPDETNAMVGVSMSRDGGLTWGNQRQVPIGVQGISPRARSSIWGQADIQGVRWRFDESAALNFGFMGADMISDVLR